MLLVLLAGFIATIPDALMELSLITSWVADGAYIAADDPLMPYRSITFPVIENPFTVDSNIIAARSAAPSPSIRGDVR